ncbi:hypothetical protein DBR32_07180 [Taibaiella sp. KBW10]|uniref:hypothetical protein n=1 Tax=Taibaiella sp. KBW10 TaxID=2153357 RepID=UPI000F5A66EB|nr:hypothetical protein [Taibaiella sp. KBW10]RQO31721.1 hypothetical protein DBR32_07180 [Taibaiella sp. KBW10]
MTYIKWKPIGITLALILSTVAILWAQTAKPAKEVKRGQAYLSDKTTSGGNITVAKFLELIANPIYVKDEDGQFYPTTTFAYTYAERGLFEDETGRAFISTDYISSNCNDKLDKGMASDMRFRAKAGDTAFIDHVTFMAPATKDAKSMVPTKCGGIKLILTK